MGILLIIVGLIWAIVGLGNILIGLSRTGSEMIGIANLMLNMLAFIFPGLITAGIGALLRKKKSLFLKISQSQRILPELICERSANDNKPTICL